MKFNHQVIHDGVLYYAGQEVPIEQAQTPRPEKAEESVSVEVKVDDEVIAESEAEEPKQIDVELNGEEVKKAVKKTKKK